MLPPERAAKGEAKAKFAAGRFGNRTRETGKQSARRGRKNQCKTEGLRARKCDLDPISRTPYGPAAKQRCIKRPDIRQYLANCHQLGSESVLAHLGASTYGLSASNRPTGRSFSVPWTRTLATLPSQPSTRAFRSSSDTKSRP